MGGRQNKRTIRSEWEIYSTVQTVSIIDYSKRPAESLVTQIPGIDVKVRFIALLLDNKVNATKKKERLLPETLLAL